MTLSCQLDYKQYKFKDRALFFFSWLDPSNLHIEAVTAEVLRQCFKNEKKGSGEEGRDWCHANKHTWLL